MNLLNMLLVGASYILMASLLVLVVAAVVIVTWIQATEEGGKPRENTQR
jgi:hypothetical protein